uniref:OTU domain-containing protein n=1 Tax=Lactuca sativa TaxID=4236 RepID=A0A9R1V8V4_LACSA|nr:hypothetical protein LSAT_V11C600321260 [Lactuca sativa]
MSDEAKTWCACRAYGIRGCVCRQVGRHDMWRDLGETLRRDTTNNGAQRRRLEVEKSVPVTRYDESAFDGEADHLKKSYNNQPNDVKANYLQKMMNIWKSSPTMASKPAIRTNTGGCPRAKLERHNTYSFGESSMFNQEPTYQRSYFNYALMDDISSEFQAYMSKIQNLEGDGHCGFWEVAVALGYSEEFRHQIHTDLYKDLLMRIDDYRVVFANDINTISESLNFYGTPTIRKY